MTDVAEIVAEDFRADETERQTASGIVLPEPEGVHCGILSYINGRQAPFSIDAPAVLHQWQTRDPLTVVDKVNGFIHAATGANPKAVQPLKLIDPMYGSVFYVTALGMRQIQSVGHGWANQVDPAATGMGGGIVRVPAGALSQLPPMRND